jgi:hypothetical protein
MDTEKTLATAEEMSGSQVGTAGQAASQPVAVKGPAIDLAESLRLTNPDTTPEYRPPPSTTIHEIHDL